MKRITEAILIVLSALSLSLGIAACASVNEIELQGELRTVYVVGQDLDLTAGSVNVTLSDGSTESLSLATDGVTVTGYDSSVIGEQELTVSYKDYTATYTVEVFSRITVTGQQTDYVVTEDFNEAAGTVLVTLDSGEQITTDFTADEVSVTFDSSKAAAPYTATVAYDNGTVSYTDTFTVNVYEPESITLNAPTTYINYNSHDEGIILTGGYLTITYNGGLKKSIALTEDMVSGFDLSLADEENTKDNQLPQTIYVTFAGETKSYTIYITFSDVSFIRKVASELSDLDWSGTKAPSLTADQIERATDAVQRYFDPSFTDEAYVSTEDLLACARVVAVDQYPSFRSAISSCNDLFQISNSTISLKCKTYSGSLAQYNLLSSSLESLSDTSKLLSNIREALPDETVYNNITMSDYLNMALDETSFDALISQVEYVLNVYAGVNNVASGWTKDSLANYSAGLDSSIEAIETSGYNTSDDASLYSILYSWNNEVYEILYTYAWYYSYKNVSSKTAIDTLSLFSLPQALTSLYSSAYYTLQNMYYIDLAYTADSTYFVWYYKNTLEEAYNVIDSGDEMTVGLYEYLTVTLDSTYSSGLSLDDAYTFDEWLYYFRNGFYGVTYVGFESSQFDALLNDYLAIYTKYNEAYNTYYEDENGDFWTDVPAMFEQFANLGPAAQLNFICALHPFYQSYEIPEYALDYSEDYASVFIRLVQMYYSSVLTTTEMNLFSELLYAMEYYFQGAVSGSLTAFISQMTNYVQPAYEALDDNSNFRTYLGDIYDRYVAILSMYNEDGSYIDETIDWTDAANAEWEAVFEEAEEAAANAFNAYYYLYTGDYYGYMWLLSAFAKLNDLTGQILESGNSDVINAFYNMPVTVTTVYSTETGYTLEYWVEYIRSQAAGYYSTMSLTLSDDSTGMIWDEYVNGALADFFLLCYDSYWTYVNATYFTSVTFTAENLGDYFDYDSVCAMMNAYRSLSTDAQYMVQMLDQYGDYFDFIEAYFELYYDGNDELYEVVSGMLAIDYMYGVTQWTGENYSTYDNDTFISLVEAFDEEYAALSDENKNLFDTTFGEMYAYYKGIYESMIAEEAE